MNKKTMVRCNMPTICCFALCVKLLFSEGKQGFNCFLLCSPQLFLLLYVNPTHPPSGMQVACPPAL